MKIASILICLGNIFRKFVDLKKTLFVVCKNSTRSKQGKVFLNLNQVQPQNWPHDFRNPSLGDLVCFCYDFYLFRQMNCAKRPLFKEFIFWFIC